MPSDVHMREQDAGIHFTVGIHPHVRGEHAIPHHAAGNDAACGNNRIERRAHASRFGEHEFRRRILSLVSANGPVRVIEVEHRRDRNDVHVGLIESLERTDIAPVESLFLVFIHKIKGVDAVLIDHLRQDILAKVVA